VAALTGGAPGIPFPTMHPPRPGPARARRFALVTATLTLGLLAGCGYVSGSAPASLAGGTPQLDRVIMPPGFAIELYAAVVEGARSLTMGPPGVVFVGSRAQGRVYALVDADGDFHAETVLTIASGLNSPNGVAWDGEDLYVAEVSRVIRFPKLADRLRDPPRREVVNDSFPTEEAHGWKFIAFGPDGRLYVPVGAPCNVCARDDERFASIMRMRPDGSELETFARGIRNSVGFDWQPGTDVLWFTDNGRDWLGDDAPPDELNRASVAGLHFGFPYCHGNGLRDPDERDLECGETTAPAVELEPHGAALGMRFYAGQQFPEEWRSGVFIAQHGSWNRTAPSGYRIAFVPIDGEKAGPARVFAEGWLNNGVAWGRPVDVQPLPDGSLLVSDDKAGAVYRIRTRM
jgi:glucose/arabinose dehydrogenase